MSAKPMALVLLGLLILVLGAGGGVGLAARHYRPLLDIAGQDAATCAVARDNLVGLAQEQGKALVELQLAAQQRQAEAQQAVAAAKDSAQADYQAANRLQQERTGGDQCTAATLIIDKELGL